MLHSIAHVIRQQSPQEASYEWMSGGECELFLLLTQENSGIFEKRQLTT